MRLTYSFTLKTPIQLSKARFVHAYMLRYKRLWCASYVLCLINIPVDIGHIDAAFYMLLRYIFRLIQMRASWSSGLESAILISTSDQVVQYSH